jgi:pyridinium-3,5-bisthiocarboxylic acid mononucleotide nickel chelatase
MNELYIEPFSGLSGDMLLSALCGLADYYDEIVDLPARLKLPDGKVVIDQVNKNGIVCRHVRIIDLHETPDQHHHHHHHHHRHLKDILQIIDHGDLTPQAREIAKDIFTIIGKSEARIHNMDLDKIHFHEVSGVDSILDIVGCAVLIDRLEIGKTYSEPVCTGFGMVKTQHGLLPVPAPATADILMNLPTYTGDEEGERVTPTGAAILKYLDPDFSIPEIRREKIAYGPGRKDFIGPNVVRVSLLASKKKASRHPH